jgi:predicted short-subunit dehydrogenase-like oxidoreductase (DUF2520 family)
VTLDRVAIVGAGRVGLTLARALTRSGGTVRVFGREAPAVDESDLVLIAVPDDAIEDVAHALARTGAVTSGHVILHTSGLRDRTALAILEPSGAALGSWHPLQTFGAAAGDPGALAGSPAVIEGDARALEAGRELAERLHLRPVVEVSAAGKAAYHAAAVFASNYLVVVAEVARRLAAVAGAGGASADLFLPIMRRTLDNYASAGAAALTGPIRRGDAGTVQRHLAALSGNDRVLYVAMGREALQLARDAGLDVERAAAIERLLTAG